MTPHSEQACDPTRSEEAVSFEGGDGGACSGMEASGFRESVVRTSWGRS